MFKLALIALGLVSVIIAAPVEQSPPVAIIEQSQNGPDPEGKYSWSYTSEDGQSAQEEGSIVPSENSEEGGSMLVQGSYSYPLPDGTVIHVTYTADKDGFVPKGDHFPTPPPTPQYILDSIAYNAAHPEENDLDAPKQ